MKLSKQIKSLTNILDISSNIMNDFNDMLVKDIYARWDKEDKEREEYWDKIHAGTPEAIIDKEPQS